MSEEFKSRPATGEQRPGQGGSGGYHSGPRPMGGSGGKRRPMMHRRKCRMCTERSGYIDWKAINTLRSFVTERGKVLSARSTGTCSGCQRMLTRAIKRARNMALLPFAPHY
jgi:small subunit ribosomal protein S18